MGVKESNEAEVLAIFEALRLFSRSFQAKLIVESDSSNTVKWASHVDSRPWRFFFFFSVRSRSSLPILMWFFCYVPRSVNSMADGLDIVIPWMANVM